MHLKTIFQIKIFFIELGADDSQWKKHSKSNTHTHTYTPTNSEGNDWWKTKKNECDFRFNYKAHTAKDYRVQLHYTMQMSVCDRTIN